MKGVTFEKIRRSFPEIFEGEKLTRKEQAFVIKQYKEYFLPYFDQRVRLEKLDYNVENIPAQTFTAILTPFYSVMSKKSCGPAWKRGIVQCEHRKR